MSAASWKESGCRRSPRLCCRSRGRALSRRWLFLEPHRVSARPKSLHHFVTQSECSDAATRTGAPMDVAARGLGTCTRSLTSQASRRKASIRSAKHCNTSANSANRITARSPQAAVATEESTYRGLPHLAVVGTGRRPGKAAAGRRSRGGRGCHPSC